VGRAVRENEIGTVAPATGMALHRELGPGLLDTVCEVAPAGALAERVLGVTRQVPIRIHGGRTFCATRDRRSGRAA